MNNRHRTNAYGFTLIEILVVVVIIGLLTTVVVASVIGRIEDAKRTKALAEISGFKTALQSFYLDNGFYPTSDMGLRALVEKPADDRVKKFPEGGYLDPALVPPDPWGNEYVYSSPGVHSRDFDIVSYGADGLEGGEGNDADVQSWSV